MTAGGSARRDDACLEPYASARSRRSRRSRRRQGPGPVRPGDGGCGRAPPHPRRSRPHGRAPSSTTPWRSAAPAPPGSTPHRAGGGAAGGAPRRSGRRPRRTRWARPHRATPGSAPAAARLALDVLELLGGRPARLRSAVGSEPVIPSGMPDVGQQVRGRVVGLRRLRQVEPRDLSISRQRGMSSQSTNVTATPVAPARPVRPIRCV